MMSLCQQTVVNPTLLPLNVILTKIQLISRSFPNKFLQFSRSRNILTLTHDEEVVFHLHGLVDDLGGDLTGVVTRHVRVNVLQHHALRVAQMFLELWPVNGKLLISNLHSDRVFVGQKTFSAPDNSLDRICKTRGTPCTTLLCAEFDPAQNIAKG